METKRHSSSDDWFMYIITVDANTGSDSTDERKKLFYNKFEDGNRWESAWITTMSAIGV